VKAASLAEASKARTAGAALPADAPQAAGGVAFAGVPAAKKSFATIVAGSAAALIIAVSGYLWYQVSSERAQMIRQAALLEEAKANVAAAELKARERAEEKAIADALEAKKHAGERALAAETEAKRRAQATAEAEKREAEKRANEIALAEKRGAEKRAREQAAVEERDRIRIAQEKAAAQRARWASYRFPPPNGGLLVYTIMPDGNPACASYDGGGCLWGLTYDQIDFRRLKPLVCGEEHRARWGLTGYENLKHWCNLARRVQANRR
jgi:hypothetical protein